MTVRIVEILAMTGNKTEAESTQAANVSEIEPIENNQTKHIATAVAGLVILIAVGVSGYSMNGCLSSKMIASRIKYSSQM